MSTTLHRTRPAAIVLAAMLTTLRALRPLLRRRRRRRAEPLAGLSDHILRDIGVARCGVLPFRLASRRDHPRRR
jgi:uncharacterized protein YjiS (DUF1127 family)